MMFKELKGVAKEIYKTHRSYILGLWLPWLLVTIGMVMYQSWAAYNIINGLVLSGVSNEFQNDIYHYGLELIQWLIASFVLSNMLKSINVLRNNETKFGFVNGFKASFYLLSSGHRLLNAFVIGLLKQVYVFLWQLPGVILLLVSIVLLLTKMLWLALLVFIIAIIYLLFVQIWKGLSYMWAQYIYIDFQMANKQITYNEAIKLSVKLSGGHRLDMVVLYFTFIGWWIFGIVTLGIGYYLYVLPYMTLTIANYYVGISRYLIETTNILDDLEEPEVEA